MRRRLRSIAVGTALLLVLGGIGFALYPREPMLLERARQVAATKTWDVNEQDNYTWLSDSRFLHFRPGQIVCCYDVVAHTETPLPALTRQILASKTSRDILNASPDGKWVLWGELDDWIFVAPPDGTTRQKWRVSSTPSSGSDRVYWLQDSMHWSEWNDQIKSNGSTTWQKVEFHSLDGSSAPERTMKPPQGLQNLDIMAVLSPQRIIAKTPDPTTTRQLSPISFETTIQYREQQEISVWNLDSATPLQHYVIRLPGLVQYAVVSFDGKRVAWLVERHEKSPFADWLGRILPRYRTLNNTSFALYVSDLDGTRLHEIGAIPAGRPVESYWFPDLCWLPGDRQLSFIYDDRLWTVASD